MPTKPAPDYYYFCRSCWKSGRADTADTQFCASCGGELRYAMTQAAKERRRREAADPQSRDFSKWGQP